jgi:hypothetical protein
MAPGPDALEGGEPAVATSHSVSYGRETHFGSGKPWEGAGVGWGGEASSYCS